MKAKILIIAVAVLLITTNVYAGAFDLVIKSGAQKVLGEYGKQAQELSKGGNSGIVDEAKETIKESLWEKAKSFLKSKKEEPIITPKAEEQAVLDTKQPAQDSDNRTSSRIDPTNQEPEGGI